MCARTDGRRVGRLACVVALTTMLFHGCATSTAPNGWLRSPSAEHRDSFGGWCDVTFTGGRGHLGGELIAVGSDSLYVLGADQLRAVARSSIEKATLMIYAAPMRPIAAWSALGFLSSVLHGYGFLISGPVWIVVGTATTSAVSRQPQLRYPSDDSWKDLGEYARFPAGLPEELDRGSLRSRPIQGRDAAARLKARAA